VPNLRTLPFVLILAGLALSGAADAANSKKTKPPPPIPTDKELGFFDNTRDELFASIKRVGIMPVTDMPGALRDRDDAKKALQDAVAKYLKLANFEVIGVESYQAGYDRFNKQLGGMYDPATGDLRREVASAVLQNARREFGSKEKLDAFVFIRVVLSAAPYSNDYCYWDGVHDRADGKPPPKNAFMDFWNADASTGSVPALSLLVQIVSTRDRVVYGRKGGIQPAAYHDWVKESNAPFQTVEFEDLLKDAQRIDRAARVATLPLVRTPKDISLGDKDPEINAKRIDLSTLPVLPPGKLYKDESPLLVPRDEILQKVRRVALSPVDPDRFDISDAMKQRLVDYVRWELKALNWEIIEAPKAHELLGKELLKTQLFDPMTGKRDEAKATAVRKSVFTALGITPTPDAILWVGLTRTTAIHRWGDVEWDGVSQSGLTMGPVVSKIWGGSAQPGAGSGGISASSFTAYLADANDTPLYRGRGGLQLLQKLNYTPPGYYQAGRADPVDLSPGELFTDMSREQPAVHAALRTLVMTPEALQAELNPPKPGKEKKKKKA
jgi:hypothetical protein